MLHNFDRSVRSEVQSHKTFGNRAYFSDQTTGCNDFVTNLKICKDLRMFLRLLVLGDG